MGGQDGRQGPPCTAAACLLLCGGTLGGSGRTCGLMATFCRGPSPGPLVPQTRADPPETPAGQVHDSPVFQPLPGLQGPVFRACPRVPAGEPQLRAQVRGRALGWWLLPMEAPRVPGGWEEPEARGLVPNNTLTDSSHPAVMAATPAAFF